MPPREKVMAERRGERKTGLSDRAAMHYQSRTPNTEEGQQRTRSSPRNCRARGINPSPNGRSELSKIPAKRFRESLTCYGDDLRIFAQRVLAHPAFVRGGRHVDVPRGGCMAANF